jgi:hypothetical protein
MTEHWAATFVALLSARRETSPGKILRLHCTGHSTVTGLTRGFPPSRMPSWANKRKRPDKRGAPKLHPVRSSGGELGRLDLQDFAGARDRDRPGLHCLWDLAHEVDVQQPVLQARTLNLHMVGELEATFEVYVSSFELYKDAQW